MGVTPDFGAEVDGWEDGSSVDPDVVKDVGTEWSNEGKGMGVEVRDAGDVTEEVPIDELLLGDPKFLTAVVDNGVLMWVAVNGEGAGGGGDEIGEDVR